MTKSADMLANMMKDQAQAPFTPAIIPAVKSEIIPTLQIPKKKKGRPTVITPDVCRKIEEVAALGGTIEKMAMYGDIHRDTLYAYLKQNPEFSDRIGALRQRPILKARITVINSLK